MTVTLKHTTYSNFYALRSNLLPISIGRSEFIFVIPRRQC